MSFYIVAASLCLLPFASPCGVLTHNQIIQRSSDIFNLPNAQFTEPQKLFSPLLISPSNAPSIQAAAFFPDWGYKCFSGATNEAAEAAHWPPFLVAAVEHIHSKYGFLNETETRSEDEQQHLERLIAFIFGIASHQAADATWHAIRLPTGLLAAIAGADFDGDVEAAHSALDVGGDLLAAARLGRLPKSSRAWLQNSWMLPMGDLVDIYTRMGRSVNKLVMRTCTMRGLAALRSEMLLGRQLADSYTRKSPMLVDEIESYYLGGMDEMTARTVSCWGNLTRWFTDGIDKEEKLRGGWGVCDVFQAIKGRGGGSSEMHSENSQRVSIIKLQNPLPQQPLRDSTHHHSHLNNPALHEATIATLKNITVTTNKFGVETYSLPPLSSGISDPHLSDPKAQSDIIFDEPIYVATYVPYGHLGASISAGYFSSDPQELAFAVGAPQESSDASRPGEGNVYIIPNSFITSLPSSLDKASISSSDLLGITRFNSSALPVSSSDISPAPISVDQRFGVASTSFFTLNRTFLAVSATGPLSYDPNQPPFPPFREGFPAGRISLFSPGKAQPEFTISVLGAELGSIGRRQWGDTLLSAALLPDSPEEYLIISSSRSDGRSRNGCIQFSAGEITILGLRRKENSTAIVADLFPLSPEIDCADKHAYPRFGAATAFSTSSKTLWVSSPGVAKVSAYRFDPAAPSSPLSLVATLGGPHRGFGHALAAGVVQDDTEWIAVASPNEPDGKLVQVGAVRIYTLSGSGSAPQLAATLMPEAAAPYTKFGRTLAAGAGSGMLWVGSEFAGGETGAVWSVDVAQVLSAGAEVVKVAERWTGSESGARFGAKIVEAPGGDVVVGVPFAGITREVQGERLFGAVAVFRRRKEGEEL